MPFLHILLLQILKLLVQVAIGVCLLRARTMLLYSLRQFHPYYLL